MRILLSCAFAIELLVFSAVCIAQPSGGSCGATPFITEAKSKMAQYREECVTVVDKYTIDPSATQGDGFSGKIDSAIANYEQDFNSVRAQRGVCSKAYSAVYQPFLSAENAIKRGDCGPHVKEDLENLKKDRDAISNESNLKFDGTFKSIRGAIGNLEKIREATAAK